MRKTTLTDKQLNAIIDEIQAEIDAKRRAFIDGLEWEDDDIAVYRPARPAYDEEPEYFGDELEQLTVRAYF